MPSLFFQTKGYWPLPKFVKICCGGWKKLKAGRLGEKEAEYIFEAGASSLSSPILILEARISRALSKKIIARIGRRRFVLSRWMGGIYSNANARNISHTRLLYDSIAPIYRYHVEPERARQLAAFLPFLPKRGNALDASAGGCALAVEAKKTNPLLVLLCNDVSLPMLSLRPKSIPCGRICVSSITSLPFPASSFDAVAHTFSNTHSIDRRAFFCFYRVLKAGGLLLYHPVKAPGEQWPGNFEARTLAALHHAGFSDVQRKVAHSIGKKRSTLVFYLARK